MMNVQNRLDMRITQIALIQNMVLVIAVNVPLVAVLMTYVEVNIHAMI